MNSENKNNLVIITIKEHFGAGNFLHRIFHQQLDGSFLLKYRASYFSGISFCPKCGRYYYNSKCDCNKESFDIVDISVLQKELERINKKDEDITVSIEYQYELI